MNLRIIFAETFISRLDNYIRGYDVNPLQIATTGKHAVRCLRRDVAQQEAESEAEAEAEAGVEAEAEMALKSTASKTLLPIVQSLPIRLSSF